MKRSNMFENKLPISLGNPNILLSFFQNSDYVSVFVKFVVLPGYMVFGLYELYTVSIRRTWYNMSLLLLLVLFCLCLISWDFYKHVFSVEITGDKIAIRKYAFFYENEQIFNLQDIKKIRIIKRPSIHIFSYLFGIYFIEIVASSTDETGDRIVCFPLFLVYTSEIEGINGRKKFRRFMEAITSDVDFSEYELSEHRLMS